jgi:hypothetical protein
MNSDLIPPTDSSNSQANNESQTKPEAAIPPENAASSPSETPTDGLSLNRQQPIPPPSEPMQYRAIGLVRGRYSVTDPEQFTQGTVTVSDGGQLNAVLLGRIMSLVKNHLDLEQEHLWVVYPRTGQEDGVLHIQIVGVWEPEKLAKPPESDADESPELIPIPSSEVEDNYFSVRGEIVYQSAEQGNLVIKIKQAPRKNDDKPKYFKLKLFGNLPAKALGQFWDLQVHREGDKLAILQGEKIADLPRKPRPKGPGGFRRGGGKPRPGTWSKTPRPRNKEGGGSPRPVPKRQGDSAGSKPASSTPKPPPPKPVKRQKPPQE